MRQKREGVEDFVRTVTGEGVTVSLGHSDATFDEAKKAVDAGASVWVHAYNGMRGLTHRELGMVGAMYQLPHTYAELICDGHHDGPKACEILIKQKGTENIASYHRLYDSWWIGRRRLHVGRIPSCCCKWNCTPQIHR